MCGGAPLEVPFVVQLTTIDLNSDLGESFGRWTLGSDAELMKVITSANVACGYHAGDPGVMRATVRLARDAGVAVGAHPGLPDLAGFGRRNMAVSAEEVEDMVLYQVGALAAIAASEGVRLQHVKPHGALYNMAVKDRGLADAIARAVRAFDAGLVLFALPGSGLEQAGCDAGLRVAREGFADRAYEADGSLTPRTRPGAVIPRTGRGLRATSAPRGGNNFWRRAPDTAPRHRAGAGAGRLRDGGPGLRDHPTFSR